jgi:hypothetical protein
MLWGYYGYERRSLGWVRSSRRFIVFHREVRRALSMHTLLVVIMPYESKASIIAKFYLERKSFFIHSNCVE